MSTNEREIVSAITNLASRMDRIEARLSRIEDSTGGWTNTHFLHPLSTNLSNIREMFLLEIIREKGLLEEVDLEAIAQKVRGRLAGKRVPWGAPTKAALDNMETVLQEIAGNYSQDPEDS